jgi:hypothetical protein
MAKLKGKKMNGGENVSNISELYPDFQVSITFDTMSRNNKNKDNILKNIYSYIPDRFSYKIFYESLPFITHSKNLIKYTISFKTQQGLTWFINYLSGQGISHDT